MKVKSQRKVCTSQTEAAAAAEFRVKAEQIEAAGREHPPRPILNNGKLHPDKLVGGPRIAKISSF